MKHSLRIRAGDGVSLGASLYEPAGREPAAHVVIHGATAVPQRYYERFATHLSERGFRVLTYDYRGVGESRTGSLRGDTSTMQQWGELDVAAAFAFLRSTAKGGPIVAFGHSFGGQTIGLSDAWRSADAAVLVASQLGYWGHWPAPARFQHAAMWYGAIPVTTSLFGHLPGWLGLGTDLPAGVARQWARWCRHPDYLLGHVPQARARFAQFHAPVLAFSFSDDAFAPPAAVEALVGLLPQKTLHHVRMTPEEAGSEVGHFGFFRASGKVALWQATTDWLARAVPARSARGQAEPTPSERGSKSL